MSKEVKRFYAPGYETEYANGKRGQILAVAASDYEALLAERDAYKKDAVRYRWIRQQGLPDAAILDMDSYYDTVTFAKGCRLDTAVDNAMQQS